MTATEAHAKADEYRVKVGLISDFKKLIYLHSLRGGYTAKMYTTPNAPGHADAVTTLRAEGYKVEVAPDPSYGHLISTRISW